MFLNFGCWFSLSIVDLNVDDFSNTTKIRLTTGSWYFKLRLQLARTST